MPAVKESSSQVLYIVLYSVMLMFLSFDINSINYCHCYHPCCFWPILVLPGWGGVCLLPMPPGGVYACTRTEGGVYGYICHMCRWLANYAYIESLTMEFIVVVLKFLSFDCWPILALPG